MILCCSWYNKIYDDDDDDDDDYSASNSDTLAAFGIYHSIYLSGRYSSTFVVCHTGSDERLIQDSTEPNVPGLEANSFKSWSDDAYTMQVHRNKFVDFQLRWSLQELQDELIYTRMHDAE